MVAKNRILEPVPNAPLSKNSKSVENIKSVYVLEVAVYRHGELFTSNILGLYSTIYKCLDKFLQLEGGLTEEVLVDFLKEKIIRLDYPTGKYIYKFALMNIDEF